MATETLHLKVDAELAALATKAIDFAEAGGIVPRRGVMVEIEVMNGQGLAVTYCGRRESAGRTRIFAGVARNEKDQSKKQIIHLLLQDKQSSLRLDVRIIFSDAGERGWVSVQLGEVLAKVYQPEQVEKLLTFIKQELLSGHLESLLSRFDKNQLGLYLGTKLTKI